MPGLTDEKRHQLTLLVLLVLAALLRVAYACETPAWYAPDEYAHFWIAEQVAREGKFPVGSHTFPAYESYQPPLYYGLASLLLKSSSEKVPFSLSPVRPPGPLVFLRLLSVLMAVTAIWIAYRAVRLIPALTPDSALWCVAFMCFLPTFVGSGAAVSNDALVVLLSAACLYFCWQPHCTARTAFWSGFFVGLAFLTKANGLVLVPFVLLQICRHSGHNRQVVVRRLVWAGGGWLVPAGLVFARNIALYDEWLVLNPGAETGSGFTLANAARAIRNLTWSFWLAFGRGYLISLPPIAYLTTAFPLMLLAALGWLRVYKKEIGLLVPTGFAIVVAVGGSLWYTFSYPPGAMTSWGKNLFPVLPMIAVFMVVGWRSVWRRCPGIVPAGGIAVMVSGCLWGLLQLSRLTEQ